MQLSQILFSGCRGNGTIWNTESITLDMVLYARKVS